MRVVIFEGLNFFNFDVVWAVFWALLGLLGGLLEPSWRLIWGALWGLLGLSWWSRDLLKQLARTRPKDHRENKRLTAFDPYSCYALISYLLIRASFLGIISVNMTYENRRGGMRRAVQGKSNTMHNNNTN